MLTLAARMARHRVTALIAVAGAVLGALALLTGTGVLAETGLRSHLPAGRLAGADVLVTADQTVRPADDLPVPLPERRTVPAALVERLGRLPGVTAAVGDLSFPAAVVGADGRVVPAPDARVTGHGWSSTAVLDGVRPDGTGPAGDAEVALDGGSAAAAGVGPGDRVEVVAAGRPGTYRVSAVLAGAPAGIWFDDRTASRLAGRDAGPRAGTVDLVALRGAGVAGAVRSELAGSGLTVATGGDRGDAAEPGGASARSTLVLLTGSLAGTILLVVGFVVAGALAVALSGQRRELALLRAVGATPAQIRRLAAAQVTVVTAAVLLPGVAAGYALAGRFRGLLVRLDVIPAELPLALSPLPALAAALLTVAGVQLSARAAARRLSRMPATEAVAESRTEPRTLSRVRTGAGLVLLAAAATLSAGPLITRTDYGAAGTSLAGIVAAIGLALAGPAGVVAVSRPAARRLPATTSAPSWLAVTNVRGHALRTGATMSALAMAVVFVLTYVLSLTTVAAAAGRDVRAATLAQHTVRADGLGGLPDGVLARLAATPGVRAAAPVSTTTVLWPHRELGDETVDPAPAMVLTPAASGVLDLDVRAGSLSGLTGDTVAVGRSGGAPLGSLVRLILGDGTPVRARVVAVYDRDLGIGPVVLSRDLAAGHTASALDATALVRTDGAAPGLAAVVASVPGLSLAGTAGPDAGMSANSWINLAVVAVLLGYLLLSTADKLMAGTSQRHSEIAVLRLVGATAEQVRSMMRREAALVGAAALAAGLVLSAVPLALLGVGFLGRPLPAGPVWLLPATAVVIAVVAFVTAELPTRTALRVPPTVALSRPGD